VSARTCRDGVGAAAVCAVFLLVGAVPGALAQTLPPPPPGPPPVEPPGAPPAAVPAPTPVPGTTDPGTTDPGTPPPPVVEDPGGTTPPPNVAAHPADFARTTVTLRRRVLRIELTCLLSGKVVLLRSGRVVATKGFTCRDGASTARLKLSGTGARRVRHAGKARMRVTAGGQSQTSTLTVVRSSPAAARMATSVFSPLSDVWGCGLYGHDFAGLVHTNTSNVTETYYFSYWRWVHGFGWDWAIRPWQVVTVAPGNVFTWSSLYTPGWTPGYYYASAAWFWSSLTNSYSMMWLLPYSRDGFAGVYINYYCHPVI
jgi:hypothetical protein